MNIKDLAAVAILAAIIGGITGAIFASSFSKTELPDKATFKEVEIENLSAGTVNAGEYISKAGDEQSLSIKNGHIQTTKTIIAGEVRGKRIMGNALIAIKSDPRIVYNKCNVVGQLAASKGGGILYLHNNKGVYVPEKGPVKEGNVMFMGYDQNGLPSLFTQEVAQKEKGKLYLIRSQVQKKEDKGEEAKKDVKKGK